MAEPEEHSEQPIPERTTPAAPAKRGLKWWATLVGIVVGTVSTLSIAGQFIYWLAHSSGPDIIATAQTSDFVLPDALWEYARKELAAAGKDEFEADEVRRGFKWLGSCVVVQIRNAGNLPADNVRVLITGAFGNKGLATIQRGSGTPRNVEYTDEIKLGQLQIEDSVVVYMWPNGSSPNELTITHSTGSTKLLLRACFEIA